MGDEFDGKKAVAHALETLQAYFTGQSDAFWGMPLLKDVGPYVDPELRNVYQYGYDTYCSPIEPVAPSVS